MAYDSWFYVNRISTALVYRIILSCFLIFFPTGDGMNAYVAYKVTTQVSLK